MHGFESGDVGADESVPMRVATVLAENSDHDLTRSEIAAALEAGRARVATG